MAKAKPTENITPSLLVTKDEAQNLITERVNKGNELLKASINSPSVLEAEREKYYKWDKYNGQLLTKLFSNDTITKEYNSWIAFGTVSNQTLRQEIEEYLSDVSDKIHKLESVIERLELFEISTTVGIENKNTNPITTDNKKIFIIHGHDENKLLELEKILKEHFGLTPIVLKDQPNNGSTTVIEKFEQYASQCSYAIALFTPDDQVENNGKKYLQARPNVIYELGWFSAFLSRKNVMLLLKDGTDIFSDFQGIVQIRFNTNIEDVYLKLQKEFKVSGLI